MNKLVVINTIIVSRAPARELSVKTEAHLRVVLQIKNITVFVFRASPQLVVNKVIESFRF